MSFNRRQFMAGLAGAAAVVGFSTVDRRWITEADAATLSSFPNVPPLDGTLVMDSATLNQNSRDEGNLVQHAPSAVLFPGSVADIQKMIKYCGENSIKTATNCGKNSVYGQTLVDGGLVIDGRSLDTIHSISASGADVDGGVLWMDLIKSAFTKGLTPAAITGYTQLGVAGTLSIGGVNALTSNRLVGQVDQLQKLEVVTGTGELVECSPTQNSDLFNAMCAGQGQCGVITRATVNMIPAPERARFYRVPYLDISTMFSDLRLLVNRGGRPGGFDWVANVNTAGGVLPLDMWATVLYNVDSPPPSTAQLMQGASLTAQAGVAVDLDYLTYVFFIDTVVDAFKLAQDWNGLTKPWSNVILPDAGVEQYVKTVMPKLTLEDLSPTTFMVLSPVLRSSFTRPLLRVPSSGTWAWLFGILTNSTLPNPGQDYVDRMLNRNYTFWKNASAIGGTRYVEDAVPFTKADWQTHYGPEYSRFAGWKQQFDPHNILAPGPGIF